MGSIQFMTNAGFKFDPSTYVPPVHLVAGLDSVGKLLGLGGLDARMKINSPLHVRHIENLANMAKQGLFVYKDRGNVPGAPQNTVIGGGGLWVMAGKNPAAYKGVASFFNYLSSPEVQSASHKRTGYLPITARAERLHWFDAATGQRL